MAIHPRDKVASNPRLQCSVCGQWKRVHLNADHPNHPGWRQGFFGGCAFTKGDHLAGDRADVCVDCCDTECKRLFDLLPTPPENRE